MGSVWAWLKSVFTLKVPERFEGAFDRECGNKNNLRFAVLPFFNILTQAACYYIYLYIYPATYPGLPTLDATFFTVFSSIYILVNVCFIILFFRLMRQKEQDGYAKKAHMLTMLFLASYVILEGFETTLEVEISGNIYRFLATFFIVAVLPVIARKEKFYLLLAYTLVVEAGLGYLIYNGMPNTNQYTQIVFAFFLACVVVANIVYTNTVKAFALNQCLMEANGKLRQLSVTDPLTGLKNRRAFYDYISKVWDEGKRNGGEITVVMLDIDNFKKYNDNYGHQKGDECIVAIANCIQSFFKRSIDMVARYGGEEFIVLLPHTQHCNAVAISEEVRQAVYGLKIRHEYVDEGYVTLSAGVASGVPGIDDQYEGLIIKADEALYAAKNSGRNRVCSAAE
ncbi:GGDEF domain-containing protein [Christensenellaceae bacterium OttesenSCG-928-K19]|nr:GGDEF domain-containing protein [Christensenellaceae bacterium OttesenSCG-928-K19]